MKTRRWLIALGLAMSAVVGTSGTASAYQVLEETGLIGTYAYSDSSGAPNATCGYERVSPEFEYMRWMRVHAPQVWAADRNSDKRDSRVVSWRFELQKNIGPGFSTVAKTTQKARAYEDQAAPFTAKKIYFTADTTTDEFTAHIVIRWLKNDGLVEGKVRLRLQFYANKSHTGVVHDGYCPGGFQYV